MSSTSLTQKVLSQFYAACILIHMARRLKPPLWRRLVLLNYASVNRGTQEWFQTQTNWVYVVVSSPTPAQRCTPVIITWATGLRMRVLTAAIPRANLYWQPSRQHELWKILIGFRSTAYRTVLMGLFGVFHVCWCFVCLFVLRIFTQKLSLTREICGCEYLCMCGFIMQKD